MKHHEREFFISMIRSGKVFIEHDGKSLIIKPLTIDQSVQACLIYDKAYKQAMVDGIMGEDEINEWMYGNGLWTHKDEEKTEGLKKDLERLRIEIYNNRNDSKLRERIRLYLRAGEKQLANHLKDKNAFYQNTREGYALSEKVTWMIKNTTYCGDKLYDFKDISVSYIIDEWQSATLSESIIRELAREEPWKSLWSIRENSSIKLFNSYEGEDLTTNQKHLVVWSQIYDNIQESMECPTDDVIKDDDLLDGWFITQSKKREKERLEREFDSKQQNEKIKNSGEVYLMVNPNEKNAVEKINMLNDPITNSIKQQRDQVIKSKGGAYQHDFPDEKQKLQMQITNAMRNNIKGGR